ncbi:MAG: TIGR03619 family F420-dependent LLM class oxidoreductase [Proteobacteria bacterium]|nr:TIGR03619 family F420-dependent LLM class oxidoreductase [Pseudomonadota bacterium]
MVFRNHDVSLTDIAMAVEARGFDSLFVPENTHMPITRRHAAPLEDARMRTLGGLFDPFIALSACAAVTNDIALGISVCLLTHRDPIATAKSVSSLDAISDGRLILGVAGGFVAEAMENHGSAFKQRWSIVREATMAMRAIWAQEEPEFHGKHFDFDPIITSAKPIRDGGPPIWIGSNSALVPGRVADYADGWIVFDGRYNGDAIADLENACIERERDFSELTISLMDPPQNYADLAERCAAGYEKFIFMLAVEDAKSCLETLDELSGLVEKIQCAFD